MAKNLWALEEENLGVDGGELETSPEEGEVADVQVETEGDVGEIGEVGEAVDSGLEATSELEEVQEVVEQAAETGEGLDPVAAEAIRIAVKAIASKVGANPKSVYSLYSMENFQSASSRKANTQYALEGVGEFLKDLWKKIKAALDKMWTKVKAFWAKHISNVGRIKKALESMKAKVRSTSGKMTGKAYLEKAPSGLISAFPGKGDLTYKSVQSYLDSVGNLSKYPGVVAVGMSDKVPGASDAERWINTIDMALQNMAKKDESLVLVGGDILNLDVDVDRAEGQVTIEFDRQPIEEKDEERGMPIADKATLTTLLENALKQIKGTIEIQKKADKTAEATTKFLNAIEKQIADADLSPEDQKAVRNAMRIGYKLSSFDAKISSLAASENVKVCKAVISYAATCLKQYK